MTNRTFCCAIEQVADWHSHLFVEPHVVAFVAVAGRYSSSPAYFEVECGNLTSRWLGNAGQCLLEISWHDDTAEKAARMRATMQSGPLVELAAIAVALILVHRIAPLGRLDVTDYGARADYRSRKRKIVLEVSGTAVNAELARRHREKIAQAQDNPFGWNSCVAVCAFSAAGHRAIITKQAATEADRAQIES